MWSLSQQNSSPSLEVGGLGAQLRWEYEETWLPLGFPCGSDSKESACNAGNPGSMPGLGRSAREGNGYPLQYSCLENPMDRGAWQATVHGVAKTQT